MKCFFVQLQMYSYMCVYERLHAYVWCCTWTQIRAFYNRYVRSSAQKKMIRCLYVALCCFTAAAEKLKSKYWPCLVSLSLLL